MQKIVPNITLDHIYADYGNVVSDFLTMVEPSPDMKGTCQYTE
jgi:hypothetical protein